MTEARLQSLIESLREQQASSATEHELRARILEQAMQRQVRRKVLTTVKLAAAMLLITPTAWAAVEYVPGAKQSVDAAAAYVAAKFKSSFGLKARPRTSAVSEAPTPASQPAVRPDPPGSADALLASEEPSSDPLTAPVIERPKLPRPVAAPASAELASYGLAHAAHFKQAAFAEAVELWRDYLRRYPRGRFAPEAQYNLAVALLKLERREEAQTALARAAANPQLDYRHREIQRLLALLETESEAENASPAP